MAQRGLPHAQSYTLYHNPYSICSLYVRYTLALAGPPKSADLAMHVNEKVIDLFQSEQLEEQFLREVNAEGMVPVLTSEALDRPLPDSVDITLYITERYPRLLPGAYEQKIKDFLQELHALNYFSLSFGAQPQVAKSMLAALDKRLQGSTNEWYQETIKARRQYTVEARLNGIQPHEIESNAVKARKVMAKLETLLKSDKHWLFGLDDPTALDAHLVIFIARMKDVGRSELIGAPLLQYFDHAAESEEFRRLMNGRRTMKD